MFAWVQPYIWYASAIWQPSLKPGNLAITIDIHTRGSFQIGKILWWNCLWYRNAIMQPLLALATLGKTTPTQMFPKVFKNKVGPLQQKVSKMSH